MKKLLVVLAALLMLVGCGGSKAKTTVCTIKKGEPEKLTKATIKHEDDKIESIEVAMDFTTPSKEYTEEILAGPVSNVGMLLGLTEVDIKLAKKSDTMFEVSMVLDVEKNSDEVQRMLNVKDIGTATEFIGTMKAAGYTCK